MLGPLTCFPPGDLTASSGLSTSRSDEKLSLLIQDLLRDAPALIATGLSPASLIQHDSPQVTNLQDAPWHEDSQTAAHMPEKLNWPFFDSWGKQNFPLMPSLSSQLTGRQPLDNDSQKTHEFSVRKRRAVKGMGISANPAARVTIGWFDARDGIRLSFREQTEPVGKTRHEIYFATATIWSKTIFSCSTSSFISFRYCVFVPSNSRVLKL